ncbi:hypothetical protein ADUPG1_006691 [Aduncisulcus paluster]|uniref:adenosine kinase n=1 Tax=Aduncisulcus paluster TaxID=2918883 RepID=A0ABQ5KJ67_9EUKA|nr:hypothetical protein ADUPG1_006691 [Aduncisulcus paluster]|eukprot:gnl/Carplike_NY0171/1501_a2042_1104.p1 GENE.gnl/Carplike_NY0171/1501_a2042_1104~~gnl/Carplike_NY0171/1501_a2042_1104.p1  ORF type:complete len:441 (-),score=121.49 gnl/Carplike_NY0171/1501_a2042_1104:127-1449(-)
MSKQIFFFGNPLLDHSYRLPLSVLETIEKNPNVKIGGASIVSGKEFQSIISMLPKDITSRCIPGGSSLNTARILASLLSQSKEEPVAKVIYSGAIGADTNGKAIDKLIQEHGVSPRLITIREHPTTKEPTHTGCCGVFVNENDHERALVAMLGASAHYAGIHIDSIVSELSSSSVLFMPGFFFTDAWDAALRAMEIATKNKIPIVLNLASPFVVRCFTSRVIKALTYAQLVIGNDAEILALRECLADHKVVPPLSADTTFDQKCRLAVTGIVSLPFSSKVHSHMQSRSVIMTCGADSIRYCLSSPSISPSDVSSVGKDVDCPCSEDLTSEEDGDSATLTLGVCRGCKMECSECCEKCWKEGEGVLAKSAIFGAIPAEKVASSDLVDTNGAGDAFCSGVLRVLLENDISIPDIPEEIFIKALEEARHVAAIVVQHEGAVLE